MYTMSHVICWKNYLGVVRRSPPTSLTSARDWAAHLTKKNGVLHWVEHIETVSDPVDAPNLDLPTDYIPVVGSQVPAY